MKNEKILETSIYEKVEYEYFDKKLKKKLITTRLDKKTDVKLLKNHIGFCPSCDVVTSRPEKMNSNKTCWKCEKKFVRLFYASNKKSL